MAITLFLNYVDLFSHKNLLNEVKICETIP